MIGGTGARRLGEQIGGAFGKLDETIVTGTGVVDSSAVGVVHGPRAWEHRQIGTFEFRGDGTGAVADAAEGPRLLTAHVHGADTFEAVGSVPEEAGKVAFELAGTIRPGASSRQAHIVLADREKLMDGTTRTNHYVAPLFESNGRPLSFDEFGVEGQAWDTVKFSTKHSVVSVHGETTAIKLKEDPHGPLMDDILRRTGAVTPAGAAAMEAAAQGRTSSAAAVLARLEAQRASESVPLAPVDGVPAAFTGRQVAELKGIAYYMHDNVKIDPSKPVVVTGSFDQAKRQAREMSLDRGVVAVTEREDGSYLLTGTLRGYEDVTPLWGFDSDGYREVSSWLPQLRALVTHDGMLDFHNPGRLQRLYDGDRGRYFPRKFPSNAQLTTGLRTTHVELQRLQGAVNDAKAAVRTTSAEVERLREARGSDPVRFVTMSGRISNAKLDLRSAKAALERATREFEPAEQAAASAVKLAEEHMLPQTAGWIADARSGLRQGDLRKLAPSNKSYDALVSDMRTRYAKKTDVTGVILEDNQSGLWTGELPVRSAWLTDGVKLDFSPDLRAATSGGITLQGEQIHGGARASA